jgi:hypothetical protein
MINVVSGRMVSGENTSNVTVTLFDPPVQPGSAPLPQRKKAERELKNTEKAIGISSDSGGSFKKESSDERENRLFDLLCRFFVPFRSFLDPVGTMLSYVIYISNWTLRSKLISTFFSKRSPVLPVAATPRPCHLQWLQ